MIRRPTLILKPKMLIVHSKTKAWALDAGKTAIKQQKFLSMKKKKKANH